MCEMRSNDIYNFDLNNMSFMNYQANPEPIAHRRNIFINNNITFIKKIK